MAEVLPISCVSCRKLKIKCNKTDPCDQCSKRKLRCEFPSTFRNIKYKLNELNEDHVNAKLKFEHDNNIAIQDPSRKSSYVEDAKIIKTVNDKLREENTFLVQDNIRLNQLLKQMNITGDSNPKLPPIEEGHTHPNPHSPSQSHIHAHSHSHSHSLHPNISFDIKPITSKPTIRKLLDEPDPDNLVPKSERLATISPDALTQTRQPISISGETTEVGEKYFGPQSSGFMIESLKRHESENTKDLELSTSSVNLKDEKFNNGREKSSSDFGHVQQSPAFIRDTRKRALSTHQTSVTGSHEDSENSNNSNNLKFNNVHSLIDKSLEKKLLPPITFNFIRFTHSNQSKDTTIYKNTADTNFKITIKLVELFFQSNPHYETFINKSKVLGFLNGYDLIVDKTWENDDDLLLLYMILVLSIQKLTPQEFIDLGLLSPTENVNYNKYKEYVSSVILMHSFDELRHNLLNESVVSVQAYLLSAEWFFVQHRYEECWSMIFHTIAIAYSIGLHVMGRFRKVNAVNTTGSVSDKDSIDENEDSQTDLERYKLWFALKNLTGQVCSILGRPNPISVKVNAIVLDSKVELDNESSKLEGNILKVLLKMGVSETLRISNSILIENFMTDCTVKDLLELDEKYDQEINTLDQLYHNTRANQISVDCNEFTGLPKSVNRTNLLVDMITLYVNRVKIFEQFLKAYEKNEDYEKILKSLVDSILKFIELVHQLLDEFLEVLLVKYNTNDNKKIFTSNKIRFGRYFRAYYPFLNAFFYQGVIVIYTFLHYKYKEFVKSDGLLNNTFLTKLESNLTLLNNFEKKVENRSNVNARLWTSNITYLINKILKYINIIRGHQAEIEHKKSLKRKKVEAAVSSMPASQSKGGNYEELSSKAFNQDLSVDNLLENNINDPNEVDMDLFYGFHFDDPFWLTNPENLPHYLSSPSEDDRESFSKVSTVGLSPDNNNANLNPKLVLTAQRFPNHQGMQRMSESPYPQYQPYQYQPFNPGNQQHGQHGQQPQHPPHPPQPSTHMPIQPSNLQALYQMPYQKSYQPSYHQPPPLHPAHQHAQVPHQPQPIHAQNHINRQQFQQRYDAPMYYPPNPLLYVYANYPPAANTYQQYPQIPQISQLDSSESSRQDLRSEQLTSSSSASAPVTQSPLNPMNYYKGKDSSGLERSNEAND